MTADQRFERLEQQLARAKWFNRCLTFCIVLVLGGWFLWKSFGPQTAWAQSGPRIVRANSFVLEDANGLCCGELRAGEPGPVLILFADNGSPSVVLSVTKQEPSLMLVDKNGKGSTSLSVRQGRPALALHDEKGKARAGLSLDKNMTSLWMFDQNSKLIWSAP